MSKRNRYTGIFFRTLLLGAALTCVTGRASAQLGFLEQLLGKKTENKGEGADSARVRRPLESFFFDDSLRNRLIFSWTVRPGFNQIDTLQVDTLLHRFQIDYPFMVPDVGSVYLGNLGGAALRINHFEQPRQRNFTFLNAYDSYLITPERAPFFNVKRPFTNLSWYMSGQTARAEEQLRVTHAQNISPSSGFNLHYLNRGTRGMYAWQQAKNKALSLVFAHTGKRYSIHTGYVYNLGEMRENGGLQWPGDLTNPDEGDYAPNLVMRLKDARNEFKTNTFFITQSYGVPLQRVTDLDFSIADKSSFFVGHALEYSVASRKYHDTWKGTLFNPMDPNDDNFKSDSLVSFYDHWFFNPDKTVDSLREQFLNNRLFVQIQPWNRDGIIGTIDGGIGFSTHKYFMHNTHQEAIYGRSRTTTETDTYLYGSVRGKLRKYVDWNAGIEYHLVGFRSQDIRLNAELRMSAFIRSRPVTLTVSGYMDSRTPDYWTTRFESNHFYWKNDFSKELDTRLEAKLEIPQIRLGLGAWQSVTTDKIYFGFGPDTDGQGREIQTVRPIQHSGALSVSGVYLNKDFKFGILRMDHRVLVQISSNEEVLPLPLVNGFAAWYLDFTAVKNVLHMQIGLSGWFHTEYYTPAYNPALMRFHNQNMSPDQDGAIQARKYGNYPFIDAFVAAKWKRMRVFAKFQHVNQGMFGNQPYIIIPNYPLNRRMFKLGFSWSFYD